MSDIDPQLLILMKKTINGLPISAGGARVQQLMEFIAKKNPNDPIIIQFKNVGTRPTRDVLIKHIDSMKWVQEESKPVVQSVPQPFKMPEHKPKIIPDLKIKLPKQEPSLYSESSHVMPKPRTLPSGLIKLKPPTTQRTTIMSIKGLGQYIEFLYGGKYTLRKQECGGGGDCFYHVIRHVLNENKDLFYHINNPIHHILQGFYAIDRSNTKNHIQYLRQLTCSHLYEMDLSSLYSYISYNNEIQLIKSKKAMMSKLIQVMNQVLTLFCDENPVTNDDDEIHRRYDNLLHLIGKSDRTLIKNLVKKCHTDMAIIDDNLIDQLKAQQIILETDDVVTQIKETVEKALLSDMYANHFDIENIAHILNLKLVIFPSDAKIEITEDKNGTQHKDIVQETCVNPSGSITIIVYNIAGSHFQLGVLTNTQSEIKNDEIYVFPTGSRSDIEGILCKSKI